MAGLIPQHFINDLLDRTDIVELINASVTLKQKGKNHWGLCPFHEEKTPSFTVSSDKQFYHCFGCKEHGTALTFLMEFERLEFVEAVETLAARAGVEVPRERGPERTRQTPGLYDVLEKAAVHFEQQLKRAPDAIEYLKGRGLSGVLAKQFRLGYAPDEWEGLKSTLTGAAFQPPLQVQAGLLSENEKGRQYDRFRGRVMFPIRDTRGRVIGFGGRVLSSDSGPKYLNSPETEVFHKSEELYGLYELRKTLRNIDRILVVEGYMDVIGLAQAGVSFSVATLGTATNQSHYSKLFRYSAEVICCFDGDNAGRQAAWRALESALPELKEGRKLKFMFLNEGEDPDSYVITHGRAAFEQQVDGAVPAIEYLFEQLCDGLDLHTLEDQAKLASLAKPYIEKVPDGILKQLMQNRLQQLSNFRLQSPDSQSDWKNESKGVSRSGPARPQASGNRGQRSASERLCLRLVSYLLKNPKIVMAIDKDTITAIANDRAQRVQGEMDSTLRGSMEQVLFETVAYVVDNPEVEMMELLGRWAGNPAAAELVALAERPLMLEGVDQAALESEFIEGIQRILSLRQQADRRRLLEVIKQDPSASNLAEFWSAQEENRKKVD